MGKLWCAGFFLSLFARTDFGLFQKGDLAIYAGELGAVLEDDAELHSLLDDGRNLIIEPLMRVLLCHGLYLDCFRVGAYAL